MPDLEQNRKNPTPVGDWVDNMYNRTLSEVAEEWAILDEFTTRMLRFYIACSDALLDPTIAYFAQQLQIPDNAILKAQIGPKIAEPRNALFALESAVKDLPEQKVAIVINGFESFFKDETRGDLSSLGHGFDQMVTEDQLVQASYESMNKRIFIFTHIGDSSGQKAYTAAFRSAIVSNFRDGVIEVKPNG